MKGIVKCLIGVYLLLSVTSVSATSVLALADSVFAVSGDKSLTALSLDSNFVVRNNKTNIVVSSIDTSASITAAAFSKDNEKLVYATEDNAVVIWNLKSKRVEQRINNFSFLDNTEYQKNLANPDTSPLSLSPAFSYVSSILYSPDGSMIAAATSDYSIRVWKSGEEDYRIPDSNGEYYPDDYFMNGLTLKGHKRIVKNLVFNNDVKTLASVDDYSINVWDIQSGHLKQTIPCESTIELRFLKNKNIYAQGLKNGKKYLCNQTQ